MNLNKYEAVFILDIRKVDDEGEAFSKELAELIKSFGGEMIESISMGRKQFAREIGKRKAGIYWNYIFTLPADKADDIRKKFKLDDRLVRSLVLQYDRPE
ncbi:MAG: 30S ribosomal protein S6 [Victivallales bacterium]|nr:30S ribosomal protein S6 [Victivallales bacterium]